MTTTTRRRALAGGAALLLGWLPPAVLQGLEEGPSRNAPGFRVQMSDPLAAAVVRSAAEGARGLLEKPACQEIFTDFEDAAGRPLRERLEALEQTGGGYLGLVFFADGRGEPLCRRKSVKAFTTPGSRVVFICGRQFSALWRENHREGQLVLIHEALHSLGLGENPPTSYAITAQVDARCGR